MFKRGEKPETALGVGIARYIDDVKDAFNEYYGLPFDQDDSFFIAEHEGILLIADEDAGSYNYRMRVYDPLKKILYYTIMRGSISHKLSLVMKTECDIADIFDESNGLHKSHHARYRDIEKIRKYFDIIVDKINH